MDSESVRLLVNLAKLAGLVVGLVVVFRAKRWTRVPRWKGFGYPYAVGVACLAAAVFYGVIAEWWLWVMWGLAAPILISNWITIGREDAASKGGRDA